MKKTWAVAGVVGIFAILLAAAGIFADTRFRQDGSGRPVTTVTLPPPQREQQVRALEKKREAAIAEYGRRIGALESRLAQIENRPEPPVENTLSGFVDLKIEAGKIHEQIAALREKVEEQEYLQENRQSLLETQLDEIADKQREFEKDRSAIQQSIARLDERISGLDALIDERREASREEEEGRRKTKETAAEPATAPTGAGKEHQAGKTVMDGVTAYEEGRYADAFRIWQPLAEAGNARAQFHLGALYFEGRGVAADMAMACTWLKRAAAGGYCCAGTVVRRVRDELLKRVMGGDSRAARLLETVCR